MPIAFHDFSQHSIEVATWQEQMSRCLIINIFIYFRYFGLLRSRSCKRSDNGTLSNTLCLCCLIPRPNLHSQFELDCTVSCRALVLDLLAVAVADVVQFTLPLMSAVYILLKMLSNLLEDSKNQFVNLLIWQTVLGIFNLYRKDMVLTVIGLDDFVLMLFKLFKI